MTNKFDNLFPTLNKISATGDIRSKPEDFKVKELNSIILSGEGEHLWLYIQKTNCNTNWVAKQLSNVCQVPQKQVGYAGLKDRHAITKQWFSIQLAKIHDVIKIQSALPKDILVLKSSFHNRKIKTGQLEANAFTITIRNIIGDSASISHNITNVVSKGVPNYFGPQRFGHDMGNISKCQDWFSGNYKVKSRNLKSILISTARSHIFNLIVANRIKQNIWNKTISGDIVQLNKSKSWFPIKEATKIELEKRIKEFDIHITSAMWGEDIVQSIDSCKELENNIAKDFPIYQLGFEKFRLKQDRRSVRIQPIDFKFEWNENSLILSFKLLPGAYATGVLREILDVTDVS